MLHCYCTAITTSKQMVLRWEPVSSTYSVYSERTKGNGLKLRQWRFRLVIGKKCFIVKVVRLQNRLARDMVESPSLEAFKKRLDLVLGGVV